MSSSIAAPARLPQEASFLIATKDLMQGMAFGPMSNYNLEWFHLVKVSVENWLNHMFSVFAVDKSITLPIAGTEQIISRLAPYAQLYPGKMAITRWRRFVNEFNKALGFASESALNVELHLFVDGVASDDEGEVSEGIEAEDVEMAAPAHVYEGVYVRAPPPSQVTVVDDDDEEARGGKGKKKASVTYMKWDASRHTHWVKPCDRCSTRPEGCFGPTFFADGTLFNSPKCNKCVVARQKCVGGVFKGSVPSPVVPAASLASQASTPAAAAGKRKVVPVPKVAARLAEVSLGATRAAGAAVVDLTTPQLLVSQEVGLGSSKRAAVEPPADEVTSSKIARKSSSVAMRRVGSQSSASSLRLPDSPSGVSPTTSSGHRQDAVLARLDALEESIRNDMRRTEASFQDHLYRLKELRRLFAEGRS